MSNFLVASLGLVVHRQLWVECGEKKITVYSWIHTKRILSVVECLVLGLRITRFIYQSSRVRD